MREHSIKCWQPYFNEISEGRKNFEIRIDDRGYQKGDELLIREFDNSSSFNCYVAPDGSRTGIAAQAQTVRRKIDFVLTGGKFGIEPGYVILSFKP